MIKCDLIEREAFDKRFNCHHGKYALYFWNELFITFVVPFTVVKKEQYIFIDSS